MNDEDGRSATAAMAPGVERTTYRLVIRARIIPEEVSGSPVPHSRRSALRLVAIIVAALTAMSWIGITVLRTDSVPRTAANEQAREVQSQARSPAVEAPEPAPAVGIESGRLAKRMAAASSVRAESPKPTQAPMTTAPDGTPLSIQEVLPDPPQSALETVQGTIRVAIRVTIDKRGHVIAAESHEPGPSRYFERLSLEASRNWAFAPAATDEPRSALLRFHFTRNGTSARASSLQ